MNYYKRVVLLVFLIIGVSGAVIHLTGISVCLAIKCFSPQVNNAGFSFFMFRHVFLTALVYKLLMAKRPIR